MSFLATLALLSVAAAPASSLDRGVRALEEFKPREALKYLNRAKNEGPYSFEDTVRLHEQLGIAYAYLEQTEKALDEFSIVLALSPGHAISYTLSPKVTFLFEQARQKAADRPSTSVDVSWPRSLDVGSTIPVGIEVVADPLHALSSAILHYRRRGAGKYQEKSLLLQSPGHLTLAEIPPLLKDEEKGGALEIFVSGFDQSGNEVLRWGAKDRPREILLSPAESWYEQWWVWTIIGGAIAAGTGTAVFLTAREPSATVPAAFEVSR